MAFYHMSQSLALGDELKPDFTGCASLCRPFVQALQVSEECFYGMILNGKYMYAVMCKSGLREWSDYAKWATEAAFEFVRLTEFPHCLGRLESNYFYDDLEDCRMLYEYDWGTASEEERAQVRLYEVLLEDEQPQKYDMRLFDRAYDAMSEHQDVKAALSCARSYYSGAASAEPVWEWLSRKRARAVRDLSALLRDDV